jgi:hypothetical protein
MTVVGISQKIKRAWLDVVLDRLVTTTDEKELRSLLDTHLREDLPGTESRAKAAGIVLRIWGGSDPKNTSLRDRAVALLPRISGQERIWLHWGMAALAYPFFRDLAEVIGRMLTLQDDFTTIQVQSRLTATWGDRATSKEAAQKLITSLVDWEVLRSTKTKGHFLLTRKMTTTVTDLQLWLLEAMLGASKSDEIEAQQLLRLPESFPFSFTVSVGDLRNHEGFNIHRQGLDMDMAAVRQVKVEPPPKPPAKQKKSKKKESAEPDNPTLFDEPKQEVVSGGDERATLPTIPVTSRQPTVKQEGDRMAAENRSVFRTLLFNRIPELVNKHFGAIPELVIYEGAVWIPADLPLDCRELAKEVIAEDAAIADVFSIEDVAQHIESIVVTIVREGTGGTLDLVEQLCSRFEKRDERKLVLIPLQGVKLSERAVDIGSFRLRTMDVEAVEAVLALWNAAIDRTTNTPDQKAAAKELFAVELERDLLGAVCLEVRVCSDLTKAEQTAAHKANILLDLLRYGGSGLHHKTVDPGVSLKGDARPGVYRRYVLPLGESAATNAVFNTPPYGELVLDEAALQIFGTLGVQRLAATLDGPLSQFESALFRSVHWFGESRMQLRPEYEIVTLAVTIESALAVPGKEGHGRNDLSEAVAVLLSEDPDHRKGLYDLTREALRQRGEVVHRGAAPAEWEGLKGFRNVVLRFIATAIHSTDRFKTCAELLSWVTSQKSGLVKGRRP